MGRMPEKWAAAQTAFSHKINTFARNCYRQIPGYSVEDVEQELLEVLWWCTFDYDPHHGATFNTFFQTSAHNRISSLIRYSEAKKRKAEWTSLEDEAVRSEVEALLASNVVEDRAIDRCELQQLIKNNPTLLNQAFLKA